MLDMHEATGSSPVPPTTPIRVEPPAAPGVCSGPRANASSGTRPTEFGPREPGHGWKPGDRAAEVPPVSDRRTGPGPPVTAARACDPGSGLAGPARSRRRGEPREVWTSPPVGREG